MEWRLEDIIEMIREKDPRYKEDAYAFVMESLNYTQRRLGRSKHVTGEELLEGMKELLIQKFGPMTLMVLKHWGIEKTEDFGNIVFNLVTNKVLSKTDEDNIESFKNRYDLRQVFGDGYRKRLEKRISRLRSY